MENPNFHLDGVIREGDALTDFEGPLSVILMLLAKNKIEIRDIKISLILDQYLEYLDEMKRMDLDIASEFVEMASYLMYIKTQMLLAGEKEPVSELDELIASLEKLKARDIYTSIQEVVPAFREATQKGLLLYVKSQEPLPKQTGTYEYRHEPVELLSALQNMFSRARLKNDISVLQSAVPSKPVYSIKDKSTELISRLKKGPMKFSAIFDECRTKSEKIAAFVSMLELCSKGSLLITFNEESKDYDVSLLDENADGIIDSIVE